ncbi:MAG: hypothetical protein AB7O44_20275 [Hyphomicrobiaceae bacterium]
MVSDKPQTVCVQLKYSRSVAIAELGGACRDLCEDTARISRGVRDRCQYCTGRGLLFAQLGQFAPQFIPRLIDIDFCD